VAIDADEVDFLSEGKDRYCIFVILSGLEGHTDPEFYERGDDPDASRAVDRDWMRHREALASAEGRSLKRGGDLSIFEFSKADVKLFWLHSSQMKRLRDEKLLIPMQNGMLGLKIRVLPESTEEEEPLVTKPHDPTDGSLTAEMPRTPAVSHFPLEILIAEMPLIPELQHLTYIVRTCRAGERIRQGHMWKSDY
jgi:hypothetical protein